MYWSLHAHMQCCPARCKHWRAPLLAAAETLLYIVAAYACLLCMQIAALAPGTLMLLVLMGTTLQSLKHL